MDLVLMSGRKVSFIEEHSTACENMGHVEPVPEKLVVDLLDGLLKRVDVPLACNLPLDGPFFASAGSSVPTVDAESFLYRGTVGHVDIKMILSSGRTVLPAGWFAKFRVRLSVVNDMLIQSGEEICFHPSSKNISYGRKVFFETRQDIIGKVWHFETFREGTVLLWMNIICQRLFGRQWCT